MPGTVVEEEDIPKLLNFLSPIWAKWDSFALQIGVSSQQIQQIRVATPMTGTASLSNCFKQVLESWVENDPNAVYERIIDVLDPGIGNVTPVMNRALAKKLREFMAKQQHKPQASTCGGSSAPHLPQEKVLEPAVPTQQPDGVFKSKPTSAPPQQPVPKPRVEADSEDVPCYPMSRTPGHVNGMALIINNVHFNPSLRLSTREGSDTDRNNLDRTLKGLGYKSVLVRDDLEGYQIERAFEEICEMDHSKHDSFVCCLLSHGKEGALYGKDGKLVKIRDLSKKLAQCEGLTGKPKIFFIQTCQGSDKPEMLIRKDDDEYDPDRDVSSLPRDSDFFFGYATSPETISLRSVLTGTWYIHELCQVLGENKHDLVTMVTLVHHAVATKKEYKYPVYDKKTNEFLHDYRQQPQLVSTLRHQVKF